MRRRSASVLAVLALAGCGDESPDPPRRAVDPAAAADEMAVRCGLIRPVPGEVPAVVPEGLLPPGSYIVRARRTGSSARATVLLPVGYSQAIQVLSGNAAKSDFKVIFSEVEVLEAEVYLSGPGGLVKFRIYGSRTCPDTASQVLFERSYTEG